ncbi:hypothetical protein [uncultured Roseobacter sp.]|nr:hypothetical protein [uncultured Roseobacter sp.]
MKAMFLAFAAMAVIAVGADFALDEMGFSAQERGTGGAVRLDDS